MITTLASTVLLRAAVVVAVGLGIAALLRRQSASVRHIVLMASLGALLILPFVASSGPQLAILPRSQAPEFIAPTAGHTGSTQTATSISTDRQPSDYGNALPYAATVLFLIWASGSTLMLLSLAAQVRAAHRLRSIATDLDPALENRVDVLRALYRIDPRISIRLSGQIATPCAIGVTQFTVLLPLEARRWDDRTLAAALTHEVAHGDRLDYVWLCVSRLVLCFYWPNPLVWYAVARAASEREIACDDRTINTGVDRIDYANCLVDLGRLQLTGPRAALGLSDGEGLARRVRSVLNKDTDRTQPRGRMAGIVGAVALAVTLGIGATRLQAPQVPLADLIADLESDSSSVSTRAAWSLGEREDAAAVPALIQSLQNGNEQLRVLSAWALGEIKSAEALDVLYASLSDESFRVREMAVLAIGETGISSSIPYLESAAAEAALHPAIAWALGELPGTQARAARASIARSGVHDPDVFAGTLPVQTDVSDARVMSNLLHADAGQRVDAAAQAGHRKLVEALPSLVALLEDSVPRVRAAAIWALDEINTSR